MNHSADDSLENRIQMVVNSGWLACEHRGCISQVRGGSRAGEDLRRPFIYTQPMAELPLDDLKTRVRQSVLDLLPDAWAIYLYGSMARGDAGPGSDLDVAVLLPPNQTLEQPWQLAGRLSGVLGQDVDLVDLRQAGHVLCMQVLAEGVVLYNAEPGQVLGWEASAMTRYGHYKYEVAGLMADFRSTGIGYADSER
jgi:predicted nucleotidyltransferase